MTMQEAQALTNPFVRCLDGRIGQIIRLRASYAPATAAKDVVGVQVRGEQASRWIPVQRLRHRKEGLCQSASTRFRSRSVLKILDKLQGSPLSSWNNSIGRQQDYGHNLRS